MREGIYLIPYLSSSCFPFLFLSVWKELHGYADGVVGWYNGARGH